MNRSQTLNPGRRQAWRSHAEPYFFIAPASLLMVVIIGVPLVWAVWVSFHQYALGVTETPFVWFDNYTDLLVDSQFWTSVWITVLMTVVSVVLEYLVGFGIATLLHAAGRYSGAFRTAVVIPWAIPPVIAGLIWTNMYDPRFGTLNELLQKLGLIEEPIGWLSNPDLAIWSVIVVEAWKGMPFVILSILAAYKSLPADIYEAAALDGASTFQRFRSITFPLLVPVSIGVLTLITIWRARAFDIVWTLTHGGPARTTEVLAVSAYRSTVITSDAGSGAAISVLLSLALIGLIFVAVRRMLRG